MKKYPVAVHTVPLLGSVIAFAVTTSPASTDLSALAGLAQGLGGQILTLVPDADVYVAFNTSSSGSVDETANTGATACILLEAKVPVSFEFPADGYYWIHHKAGGTTKIRAWVSSRKDLL